jgi:NADH-quinone oxidoreductase subunit D
MRKGNIKVDDKKITPPSTCINETFNEAIIMHFKLFYRRFFCLIAERFILLLKPLKGEFGVFIASNGTEQAE